MASAKMKKIRIVAVRSSVEELLRELMVLGCVQVSEAEAGLQGTGLEEILKREDAQVTAKRSVYNQMLQALDMEALEKELRGGRLHAGLDVFETEPIPEESSLWQCPRLILTPHVAGDLSLPYTVRRIVELFLEDFENYCAGRPLIRLVDRSAGY